MGGSGQVNWRIGEDFVDWSSHIEKRLMHEERRPTLTAATLFGTGGFGPVSARVYDWNDDDLQTNGYWYAAPGAVNGPPDLDNTRYFMGTTQVDADGFGLQRATEYRPPVDPVTGETTGDTMVWPNSVYTRRFFVPVAEGQTQFSVWGVEGSPPTIGIPYTPGVDNPSPNYGTGAIRVGEYVRTSDWVSGRFSIVLGTTNNFASFGTVQILLPTAVEASAFWPDTAIGTVTLWDNSATVRVSRVLSINSVAGGAGGVGACFMLPGSGATGGGSTGTDPFSYAVSDMIKGTYAYKAAP